MEEDVPKNSSTEVENANFLEMELEALQSIYVNEVEVLHNEQSTSVSIDLHPATADNLDEQYVKMTLAFSLDNEYPNNIPEIHIRNPRGLSDEKVPSIIQDLKSIAENRIGNSMLFEMIEAAKEQLTVENRPCGECAICLYSFVDDDVFTKTNCYHYFHSHCLARYSKIAASEEMDKDDSTGEEDVNDKELVCPVCRLPIHFEGSVEDFPPPSLRDDEIVISDKVLEIQKKMADLFQKQVDQGGIIDIEAEKNKYLLEISNVPTRTSEEAASSDKGEENDGAQSQSPKKEIEKNVNPDPNSSRRDGKTRNYKNYNKQSRNNYNPDKTNKKYDNAKPKYNKERTQNSEETYDDPKATGSRSEANLYRKNERWNNYGSQRRYDDDYSRGNYYRYQDTRGGSRGHRFPSNGYERRNYRGGFRGRGGRSNSEREVPREQDQKVDNEVEVSTSDLEGTKELIEKNSPDEHERNNSGKNRQHPRKKYSDNERDSQSKPDSYPDWDVQEAQQEDVQGEVAERDDRNRRYPDKFRQGSYRDRRQYSDIRYSDKDSQRRGGYSGRYNSERGSYGRGRNRGSFRNSFRKENSEEDAQAKEGTVREEEEGEDRGNRYPSNQKRQFSDQSYRGGRGNSRRNGNSYRSNFDEKRDDYRNGIEDSKDNEEVNQERSSDVLIPSGDKKEGQQKDLVEEGSSNRYSNRNSQDHSQRYEDRRDYNTQRRYRDSDRNRQNSDTYEDRRGYNSQRGYRDRQNSENYRRNQRYSNDRPFRNKNDSYQYKNNSSRKYNSDQYQDASNPTVRQVDRENSELHSGETSSEKTVTEALNKIPAFNDEKGLSLAESSQNEHRSNETSSKDVPLNPPVNMPAAKPNANFSNSPKMQQPPPGFSNPMKKVVYGLKAANPPPGFPRS